MRGIPFIYAPYEHNSPFVSPGAVTVETHCGPRFPLRVFHLEECRSCGAIVPDSSCVVHNGDHLHPPGCSARFPYRGRSRHVKSHPLSGFDICATVRLTVTGIPNAPGTFCRLISSTTSVWEDYVKHTFAKEPGKGFARQEVFRMFHQVC